MLARERQKAILVRVQKMGTVRVTDLARDLDVAEETIRRDLEMLSDQGKLVRVHGGAMQSEDESRELPFDVRIAANAEAKREIAAAAMKYIVECQVIGLDASSTACELAHRLPDVPLTVLTNSLVIARILATRQRVKTICTGGTLDTPSLSFVGSLAEDALARFHIDRLFFSCKGLDVTRGLSVAADEHARMKRRMMDMAEKSYLLIDHTKFGVKSVVFFARLDELDGVITDHATASPAITALTEAGAAVQTASA